MQSGARLSKFTPKPEPKVQEKPQIEEKLPEQQPEPRVAKEKFTITRELPSLDDAPAPEPEVEIETEKENPVTEIVEEKPVEKVELELPVISDIRDTKDEITDTEEPHKKEKTFKVNFSIPQISRSRFDGMRTRKISSSKLMLAAITLVVVGIVGAISALLYIESSPSTGKALSAARETLSNVQTMSFTLNSSFDLLSTPTDEDIAKGAKETDLVMVYKATGKYDKGARKMDIDGEYQSMGEQLVFKQTLIANDTYIKYSGREYIKGTANDAILSIQSIEAQNLYPKLTDDTKFGFGAEEMIGGENTYRFRAYPASNLIDEYIVNYLSDIVKKLYPLNPPVITAEDIEHGEVGYRLWVAIATYRPVKLQMLLGNIKIDLGAKGIITITDFQTDLLISSINQTVVIDVPI